MGLDISTELTAITAIAHNNGTLQPPTIPLSIWHHSFGHIWLIFAVAMSILKLSLEELVTALAKGHLTSSEVLKAYRARAELIHHACNAVACWIPDAEQGAREADEHLQRTGQVLGPLHGVPFTVKDHVMVKQTPITMGMKKFQNSGKTSRRDEHLVTVFRSLGAIPFAKSTMSQLLGFAESVVFYFPSRKSTRNRESMGDVFYSLVIWVANPRLGMTIGGGSPAHGDTLNPWDTRRSSGGSSAGEGALIGGGAAPFGIGSDVGGSVRVPAAFCGISSLKPTCGRISMMLSRPGEYFVPATAGVMARTAADLSLVYSHLLAKGLNDGLPRLPPIPFNQPEFSSKRPLRIGYYVEEYTFPKPCAAVCRAMEEACSALKALGHELVEFKPHTDGVLPKEMVWDVDASFYVSSRPYKEVVKELKSEKSAQTAEEIKSHVIGVDSEEAHPDLIGMFSSHEPYASRNVQHAGSLGGSSIGHEQIYASRDKMRERFYKAWQASELDVLLCPAFATPALHVEEVPYSASNVITTRVYNLLDMPAGVVTVTSVNHSDLSQGYDPGTTNPDVTRMAMRAVEDSLGLPVAVQLVTLPWKEELCLRAMTELEKAVACDQNHSHHLLQPEARRSPSLGAAPIPLGARL